MTEDEIMPRTKDIDDDEILELFDEHDAPYMTASELAEDTDMSRQGIHNRLVELHEKGKLCKKKTGRMVGWWLA